MFDQKENNIDKFRKNPAKKTGENQPKVSFDDIGGAAQAKEELKTIIEFIRNPEYFQGLGARMPKGIILEGPPGTGKTLLARAVASESSANFFYMSASEFVELYVGVGASRVRDLFNEAKKNLPAIIYIDELDAVGQRRNLLLSGGDEERSNTLNQLLTELDGFESYQGIFVMGSTNRVDILDVALLRPGRFDKRVIVDIPSFEERCQILEIHLKNKKIADNVNIEDIARYTIDFNGAELANIVNQAAILATKNKCDSIDKHLLEEATKAQGAIIPSVVNVQEFKEDISKEIVGQYVALTAIGWSVCSHYANIRSRSESGVSYGHKPNLFLYGPPGSGKTTIIKATANSLEVPFVKKPATGLVKDKTYMQTILNQLLRAANNDIRRAECGIVWLYGMEEITFDDFKFFQEELARAIEGEKFDLAEDFFAKNSQSIHTQNILFICELTVDGKSRSRKSVFKKKSDDTGESKTDNEILVDLGLVTRLINQFPIIASTEILKQEELLEILTYGESSPVSQFTHHYEKLGIEVELEKSALDIVAKECLKRGGDARLLDSLLNDVKKYLGDWVSEKKVTVTALMVENALTRPVSQKKTSNSNDSRGKIATTSEEVEKSSSEVDIDAQYNFFIEVLELTGESEGDSETVYPLLKQNIDLLNDNLIPILQTWAEQAFSQVEVFLIEDVGRVILKFSNLIMQFPLGNKASNMEIAIAGYKEVLKVFTRESNQKNWATTQNNLGIAYNYRIRGDKAENIEQAIAAIQQALSVDTKEDFPYEWARDQNNLGNAYIFRICGNKAENIEQAIAVFEQVLSVVTKEDFPYDWARDQNNLGNAYILRICGSKAENIEQAIAAFEQALSVDTKEDFPYDWARDQNNLGNAYILRICGNKAENIEQAIAAFEQALSVDTKEDFPYDWATTQNNLGFAYSERIRGDKAKNLEQAIATFKQISSVYTESDFPYEWARTQNNLGSVYSERIRGDKAKNLEQAIATFKQISSVYTKSDFPYDWARTQNNLGSVYKDRIYGKKAENIEQAITAFEQALSVHTKSDFPYDWATTQNGLGNAYRDRIRGDKAENIELAITTFEQALSVYTKSDFPYDWATTQNNLGNAYSNRIRGDKAENIELAITAFEQALSVYTKSDFPYDWATTQNGLGNAYSNRIRGDKAENIEKAIATFEQALSVCTKPDFPYDWAITQNNLGNAYIEGIHGDKAENIEQAITAFKQALSVYTKSDFPYEWATTQNNLGLAYSNRIRGDKAENIEKAITTFEQVLSVYTKSDFPYELDFGQKENS
ncbi:AAA family ATPase [Okeania sp. KiyG1]|uniref:AAA family ATPase n=1 Tax=Okeania sp. KiyG1 TaxID=2720165 RepID=UPI0019224D2E|nr:AAA family ATPase [Okeania sp. KiyG1]GGA46280.1 hypothetical protein CYANOKiyG1_65290 [Okeania sp. KiyG1]